MMLSYRTSFGQKPLLPDSLLDLSGMADPGAIHTGTRGPLQVAAAAVLWGTTGTTAQLLGDLATTQIAALRLVTGAGVLLVVAGRPTARPGEIAADATRAITLAGVAAGLFQPAFFASVDRVGVTLGTLVTLGSAPLAAAVAEWRLDGRPPTPTWAVANGLCLAGLCLLVGTGGPSDGVDALGVVLALGSGLLYATYTTSASWAANRGVPTETVVLRSVSLAAALAAPLLFTGSIAALASPAGIAGTAWLGAATTALAYRLFVTGAARTGAAPAATLGLLEPLTAVVLAAVLLGERLAPAQTLGALVLSGGLATVALRTSNQIGRAQRR
jgi:DME family drug/metabolite transporter